MNEKFVTRITGELKEIETAGLFKKERIITSEQGPK
jgi:glycine C-acetyltransferase